MEPNTLDALIVITIITIVCIAVVGLAMSWTQRRLAEDMREMQLRRLRQIPFEDNNLPELIYEIKWARLYL